MTGLVSRTQRLLTDAVRGIPLGVAPPSHSPEMLGRCALPVERRAPDDRHQTLGPGH